MNIERGRAQYAELEDYASKRAEELAPMLRPFIDVTNHYGEMICEVILILGQASPVSRYDSLTRDLAADVFDFLNEARPLIIRGKLEIDTLSPEGPMNHYRLWSHATSIHIWPTSA